MCTAEDVYRNINITRNRDKNQLWLKTRSHEKCMMVCYSSQGQDDTFVLSEESVQSANTYLSFTHPPTHMEEAVDCTCNIDKNLWTD